MGFQTMKNKRRHVDLQRALAAATGGFYQALPSPGAFTCTACNEERNSVGQEDGLCLRFRLLQRMPEQVQDYVPMKRAGAPPFCHAIAV